VRAATPAAIRLKRALHDAALAVNPWTSRTADPRSCPQQMSTGPFVQGWFPPCRLNDALSCVTLPAPAGREAWPARDFHICGKICGNSAVFAPTSSRDPVFWPFERGES
jgi:hypothetical protein